MCLPVRLQRGAEEVLWLRHWGSSAESQLSLVCVCVLVLRLTLQRRIDGDGNLLHCRWLEKVTRGVKSAFPFRIIFLSWQMVPCSSILPVKVQAGSPAAVPGREGPSEGGAR